jgi:hypothetical protein
VIYSLPVIKALGGGVLFLSGDNRYPYPRPTRWQQTGAKPDWVSNLHGLLTAQEYVWSVHWTQKLPFSTDVDLNSFRQFYQNREHSFRNLFDLHQMATGTDFQETEPWLTVDSPVSIPGRPIIVNRTERFHNDDFPWRYLVHKYGQRMAFVGDWKEAAIFQQQFQCPHVIYQKTGTMLEAAQLIAGAKVFIGNQSCPLAIGLGLGKNVIVETWLPNQNCKLKRDNAIHCLGKIVDIPPEWL